MIKLFLVGVLSLQGIFALCGCGVDKMLTEAVRGQQIKNDVAQSYADYTKEQNKSRITNEYLAQAIANNELSAYNRIQFINSMTNTEIKDKINTLTDAEIKQMRSK
jgi:hypothetical protein